MGGWHPWESKPPQRMCRQYGGEVLWHDTLWCRCSLQTGTPHYLSLKRMEIFNLKSVFKEMSICTHSWIETHQQRVGSVQSSRWFGPSCTQVFPRWAGQLCWSRAWQTGGEEGWADLPSQWPSAWQWHRLSPAHCLLCIGSSPHPPVPAGWWAGVRGFGSWPVWMIWWAGHSLANAAPEEAPQSCCTQTWQCFHGRGTLSLGAVESLEGLFEVGNKALT